MSLQADELELLKLHYTLLEIFERTYLVSFDSLRQLTLIQ